MPVHFKWYDSEKNILLEIFEEHWTPAEYRAMIDAENEELADCDHPVSVIIDTTAAHSIPHDMLSCAMYGAREASNKITLSVFIITQPFIRTMIETVLHVFPYLNDKVFFTDSMENALNIVHQRTQ